MKRLLILALVVVFFSAPAYADGGLIGLYLDTWGEICDIDDCDIGVNVLEVHVIHKLTPCATGSQFKVVTSAGFTGSYLGEEFPDPISGGLGNSRTGIAVPYGAQREAPIHVMTIRYLVYGTSEPNSFIQVLGDDSGPYPYDTPVVADCSNPPILLTALGGTAFINGDGTLMCTRTPVQPSTWGQIKALYRN